MPIAPDSPDLPDIRIPRLIAAVDDRGISGLLVLNLAVVGLYFVLGLIVSQFFESFGVFPAPIWLPASIAMVGAMIGGWRVLPGLFLASLITNSALFESPLHTSLLIASTNALGPILGALALRRLGLAGRLFTSFSGIVGFLSCTTLLNPAISATGGTFALSLGQPLEFGRIVGIWSSWWLSDSGGTLYLAVALILWLGLEGERKSLTAGSRHQRPTRDVKREDFLVWGAVAAGTAALFLLPSFPDSDLRFALPFLLVVPLSWIALRISLRSAYTLVSLVAVIATIGTVAGLGPYQDQSVGNPLALVGALVVLLAMNILTIVALVSERDAARDAKDAKAMLLAETSHELRTPLNAIIGFSAMMDNEAFGPLSNEQYREYVRIIRSSGEHLLALINDLLEMSKIEGGHVILQAEPIDLNATIRSVIALLAPQAHGKSIEPELQSREADIIVEADLKALRRVLINLLSNAIKFTPANGSVQIRSEITADGDAVIQITDTGLGIPADRLQRLFKPFERGGEQASEVEGSGLGLCIARGLIMLHGGTVTLDSELGQGTVATVTLPANRVLSHGQGANSRPRQKAVG